MTRPMYKCKINLNISNIEKKEEVIEEMYKDLSTSDRFSRSDAWFNYKIKRFEDRDNLQICMRCDLLTFAMAVTKLEANEGILYEIFSTSAVKIR